MLSRSPIFTLAAISTLALGIGANTAIFSIVDGVVLRPLPYAQPEQLVMAWIASPSKGNDTVRPNDFLDWRRNSGQAFASLSAFCYQSLTLTGDLPERLSAASVTSDFFQTLGVRPVVGRVWDGPGEERIAVLSHGLWKSRFGGDPKVVGRQIRLNGESYDVLGVMPPTVGLPDHADLWVRARRDVPVLRSDTSPDKDENLKSSYLRVVGRLKPGVSLRQAQTVMDSIAARRARELPATNGTLGVKLVSLHEQIVGRVESSLLIILGAVAFVLLIACVNVANLLLARAGIRKREVGIRIAMGAGRNRLLRQFLSESFLLAGLSGLLGLLLGYWVLDVLVRLSPPDTPRIGEVGLDLRVLLFAFGITLLTGLLFGLLPALQTSNPSFGQVLVGGGRTMTEGRRGKYLLQLLMALEVAISLVLLVGAGLMVKSFLRLNEVKVGFDSSNVLAFKIDLPQARYPEGPQQVAFFRQALERVQAIPGVRSAETVLSLPLSGDDINLPFEIEGHPSEPAEKKMRDGYQAVSPGYFAAMRIPVLRGRSFTAGDVMSSPQVAIVSERMVKRYWPDRDPIGQRITFDDPKDPKAKWITIIGVVGDVRFSGLAEEGRAELYRPFAQDPWPFMAFVVRAQGDRDPLALVASIRSQIATIDPEQPIANIETLGEMVSSSVARPRLTARLLGAFALLALLLASVGLYGLVSFNVSKRTHEIGIRMALGAQRRTVLTEIMTQGVWITLIGIAFGAVGALICTRLLASLLFEVSATDVTVYLGMPLVLLLVALVASLIPAYRASKIDPLTAFRMQ